MSKRFFRRGGSAVEFALLMPIFSFLSMGALDYGAFFLHQTQVNSGFHSIVRSAGMQPIDPSEIEAGSCEACVEQFSIEGNAFLDDLNVSRRFRDVDSHIVELSGTCALFTRVEVPYYPIIGLVPTPDKFVVTLTTPAQHASGC